MRIIILLCIYFIFSIILIGCNKTDEKKEEEIEMEESVVQTSYLEEDESVVQTSYSEEDESMNETIDINEEDFMNPAVIYAQTEEVIGELNENSNLHLDMLSFVEQYPRMRYMITVEDIRQALHDESPPGSFAIRDEFSEVRIGSGQFGLFPYYTDDIRLMQLIWDVSGSFHVFGIDVEGSVEEAEAILIQRGYEEQEPHPHFQSESFINRHNKRMRIFANSLVSVSFFVVADCTEILEIRVTVDDPFERRYSSEERIEDMDGTD